MKRTGFLRTAYNKSMQPLLLLLLLAMTEKDADFKASLQKFLAFYRENRALLAALLGESPPAAPPPRQEKSRPEQDGADGSVLETYLGGAPVH